MFRIKICGVTDAEQVALVAATGADAVGLNFYPRSPRYLDDAAAREVAAAVPAGMVKVGVFVNSPAAEIIARFDRLSLDLVQLHGDEPPEFLRELEGRPILRAFRLGAVGMEEIAEYLAACRVLNRMPAMVLIDSHAPGEYGGSGQVADWRQIVERRELLEGLPLVLAGGLTSENIESAIRTVRPDAVDACSGVETSPGVKDAEAVAEFCRRARV